MNIMHKTIKNVLHAFSWWTLVLPNFMVSWKSCPWDSSKTRAFNSASIGTELTAVATPENCVIPVTSSTTEYERCVLMIIVRLFGDGGNPSMFTWEQSVRPTTRVWRNLTKMIKIYFKIKKLTPKSDFPSSAAVLGDLLRRDDRGDRHPGCTIGGR